MGTDKRQVKALEWGGRWVERGKLETMGDLSNTLNNKIKFEK